MLGEKESLFASVSPSPTLTRSIAPVCRSKTKTSSRRFVSFATRFPAVDMNATKRPFALIDGVALSLLADFHKMSGSRALINVVSPGAADARPDNRSATAPVTKLTVCCAFMLADLQALKAEGHDILGCAVDGLDPQDDVLER